jgi:hypothetical protein
MPQAPAQLSLFDIASAADTPVGLAGVMPAVRAVMARVAKDYGEGRKLLVDAINEVARRENVALTSGGGKRISKDQLDKWLQSGERGHGPTPEAVWCFCVATKNTDPLEPIWKAFRLTLIPASDVPLLEYGKNCDTIRKATALKRKQEARL